MNWKQHIIVRLVFGLVLSIIMRLEITQALILMGFAGLCALLPDLDHQMSKGREVFDKTIPIIALTVSYYNECSGSFSCLFSVDSWSKIIKEVLVISGAYFLIMTFLKPQHRGVTHTIVACVFFGLILYVAMGTKFALFGSAGYLSHLVADKEIKII